MLAYIMPVIQPFINIVVNNMLELVFSAILIFLIPKFNKLVNAGVDKLEASVGISQATQAIRKLEVTQQEQVVIQNVAIQAVKATAKAAFDAWADPRTKEMSSGDKLNYALRYSLENLASQFNIKASADNVTQKIEEALPYVDKELDAIYEAKKLDLIVNNGGVIPMGSSVPKALRQVPQVINPTVAVNPKGAYAEAAGIAGAAFVASQKGMAASLPTMNKILGLQNE